MSSRALHSVSSRHASLLGRHRSALNSLHDNSGCVVVSYSGLPHAARPSSSSASAAWCYRPSVTRRPTRAAVLSTYRQLLHLVHRSANGDHQLWSQRREEQISRQAADAAAAQQAKNTDGTATAVSDGSSDTGGSLSLYHYSSKWVQTIRR